MSTEEVKEVPQISASDVEKQLTVLVRELEILREKYTQHYNTMKQLELQITAKVGAMEAFKAILNPTSVEVPSEEVQE